MKINMSESAKIKGSHCPYCGHFLDGCTGVGEEVEENKPALPGEGDFTVCAMCAEFAVFDKNLVLQKLTEEQLKGLREQSELFALLTKIQRATKYARAKVTLQKMQENFEGKIKKWRK